MSKEAADALASNLGIWQGHLLTLRIAARVLQDEQQAYLQGRAPRTGLSEKITN